MHCSGKLPKQGRLPGWVIMNIYSMHSPKGREHLRSQLDGNVHNSKDQVEKTVAYRLCPGCFLNSDVWVPRACNEQQSRRRNAKKTETLKH